MMGMDTLTQVALVVSLLAGVITGGGIIFAFIKKPFADIDTRLDSLETRMVKVETENVTLRKEQDDVKIMMVVVLRGVLASLSEDQELKSSVAKEIQEYLIKR